MYKIILLITILLFNNFQIFAENDIPDKNTTIQYTKKWEVKTGKKINEGLVYQYILAWYKQDFDKIESIVYKIKIEECIDYILCLFSHEELITTDEAKMYFPYLIQPLYERYTKEVSNEVYSRKFISLLSDPNMSEDAFNFFATSADRWVGKEDFEELINVLFSVLSDNVTSEALKVSASSGIENIIYKKFSSISKESIAQCMVQEKDWQKLSYKELIDIIIKAGREKQYKRIKNIANKHLVCIHKILKRGKLDKMFYSNVYTIIKHYEYILGLDKIVEEFHNYLKVNNKLPMEIKLNIAMILCNRLDAKEIIPDVEQLITEWEKQYAEAKDKSAFYDQKSDIRYLKEYIKTNKEIR